MKHLSVREQVTARPEGRSSADWPGTVRSAAIGGAAGAATAALIGAIVQENQRERYYREAPPGGYPYGRPTGEPGIVRSPYYPYSLIDVRDAPPGALVIDPSTGQPFVRP